METFFGDLMKPSWWISTLVALVFLTWLADWLKKKAAAGLALISQKWAHRNKLKADQWNESIAKAAENIEGIQQLRHDLTVQYLMCILQLILAIFGYLIATQLRGGEVARFLYGLSMSSVIIMMLIFMKNFLKVSELRRKLSDALDLRALL